MMANEGENQQDVYYWFDDMGRACVDLYAKALKILDSNDPDCWKRRAYVYQVKLVSHSRLEVSSQHSPVCHLTPDVMYHVYFDLKLMHNAKGFKNPVMFEFSDQHGITNRFPLQLAPGDMKVFVGKFISTPNFQNVRAKMYDINGQEKSGLIVRRVRIMLEDSRHDQGFGLGRGQGGWRGNEVRGRGRWQGNGVTGQNRWQGNDVIGRGRWQGNSVRGGFGWQNQDSRSRGGWQGGRDRGNNYGQRWEEEEESDDDEEDEEESEDEDCVIFLNLKLKIK